jgi:ABC-type branched-subunit amino acid transport system substrate-binding protein
MTRITRRALLSLAALVGLSGAVAAAGVTNTEIVLGMHIDLSGPAAAGMPALRNGTQMRLDEANEAGGINGRRFKLIVEDNASQPQQAVRAVDKLIRNDEVFAIINPFGSGTNAAVLKRAVDAGVLYYAPWAASGVLRRISGNSPLLFTTIPNYDTTTRTGLAWMIDEYKPQRIGFIYQEGPLGDLVRAGVQGALDAKNLKLAAEAAYKVGDIDFSSQVARMKAADTDLIVIATVIRETIGIPAEVKKLGWSNVKVLTAVPGRTTIVAQLGKDAVEGLYGIGGWKVWAVGQEPAEVKSWMANYKRRFNLDADENAMLAYAYADMFVKGVTATGRDLNAEKLAKALGDARYASPVYYDQKKFNGGHLEPETVQIDQLKGGVWTPVSREIVPGR